MADAVETATVGLKACRSCRAGLIETDRYCRWCGIEQEDCDVDESRTSITRAPVTRRSLRQVRLIDQAPEATGRTVSAPLVSAILAGVSSSSRSLKLSRKIRRVIVVLVSVPVWLIVVLLSPVDAYLAIKDLSSEI